MCSLVVYEHWRPDTNQCFYVGQGSFKRPYDLSHNKKPHKDIVSELKRKGLKVEVRIVATAPDRETAHALEIERIAYRRMQGAPLVNRAKGGNSANGCVHTAEQRAKKSAVCKARWAAPEERARQSAANRAIWADPAKRAAHSEKLRAAFARPEVKAKLSAAMKTLWQDPVYRGKVLTRSSNSSRQSSD